jgi:predicted lysophospholipase L1 biosynthesis ABC-type transport system permease subunit
MAALGLVMMIPVALGLGGRSMLELVLVHLPQIIVGCTWALFLGYRLDRLLGARKHTFAITIVSSAMIFVSGALMGSVANLLIASRAFSPTAGLGQEIFDWFVKPIYWLYVFGIPCSLGVGAAYFGIWRILIGKEKNSG